MARKSLSYSRRQSRIKSLRPLAGLLATGLSCAGLAAGQSKEYPKYQTRPQKNGIQIGRAHV